MTSQQTSVPYSADVLQPHDTDLFFAVELGTNVTQNAGEPFNTQAVVTENARTAVDGRLGMLRCWIDPDQGDTPSDSPRGSTYLIPDWSNLPPSPALAVPTIAIFAHLINLDASFAGSGSESGVVFGGLGLVGDVPAEIFTTTGLSRQLSPLDPWNMIAAYWGSGGGGGAPDFDNVSISFGQNLYVRALCFYDPKGDETEIASIAISRDGLGWWECGSGEVPGLLRRVGVYQRQDGFGALDWIRVYNWPLASIAGPLLPQPQTGGRLFVG